jgi:RecJ-like exonuclease
VADVLFQADGALASRLAEQYDDHLGDALETATANAFEVPTEGPTVSVLDAVEFTSKYDFPPTELLVTELHRSLETPVTVVVEDDALYVESDEPIDRRAVADDAAGRHPAGGVEAMGGADGHIRFLQGERDAVIDVVIEAIGESLQ